MDNKAFEKKVNIAILLRNRHDGPGGLERLLEDLEKIFAKYPVTFFFYALYPPVYTEFTRSFSHFSILSLPKPLNYLEQKLPHAWARTLRKITLPFYGDKIFDQMVNDKIDLLIYLDLSKQFLKHYPMLQRFKKVNQIPIISWIHSSLSSLSSQKRQHVIDKIDLFDGHLAISKGLALEIATFAPNQPIDIIYNPIKHGSIVNRDPSKFLYIGRIDENKRVVSLLSQLVNLKGDWTLDLYGSTGSEKGDLLLQTKIDQLGLSQRVLLHGWKNDPWEHITAAGILLLNSEKEGFGLVVAEAMMRGIPVLSSNSQGPSELIQNGINGWTYPIDNEVEINIILQKILDYDLALPSPEIVQKSVLHFDYQNYASRFLQSIYNRIEECNTYA